MENILKSRRLVKGCTNSVFKISAFVELSKAKILTALASFLINSWGDRPVKNSAPHSRNALETALPDRSIYHKLDDISSQLLKQNSTYLGLA